MSTGSATFHPGLITLAVCHRLTLTSSRMQILDEILDSDAMKELQESAQDSAAKLNDYANSIIQNALANDADVRRNDEGEWQAEG
ncbi:hypothetical protein EEPDABAO_00087 [Klebsiella phage mfs]|uniref:Uncharacterized protein n=1 Tax=Klebsiella phage mfs TaxID=2985561 RepID=A0A9X9JVQ3_9CAUD|nr:hypothetical protein EEPDABAO_00087 [Klebsiella phage mfs]